VLLHSTMLFVVAAHGIVWLATTVTRIGRRDRPAGVLAPILAWLFAGTASLQVLALSFPEFLGSAVNESAEDSDWQRPLWLVQEALRQLGESGLLSFGLVTGGAVILCGVLSYGRENARVAGLLTLPAVICGMAIVTMGLNLWPRFFFFALGFLLLLTVRGLMVIGRVAAAIVPAWQTRPFMARAAGAALCLVVVAASLAMAPRLYALPKQDFAGARDFVTSQRGSRDHVVAVGLAGTAYKKYFAPEWDVVENGPDLQAFRRGGGVVWLVFTLPVQLQAWHPDIWQIIESECGDGAVFPGTLGGGDVTVCRLQSLPEAQAAGAVAPAVIRLPPPGESR
jgi:hypothetical protein